MALVDVSGAAITPNLLLNIGGFLLSQKRAAIYLQSTYEEPDADLNALGINTNQALFGAFSGTTEEVLDGNFLMPTAIMNADVKVESKITTHPVESGVVVSDHKIINPIEISMRIVMPVYLYESVIKQLKDFYNRSEKLVVLTKDGVYKNMIVEKLPHTETPENYDRLVFDIGFKEVLIVDPKAQNAPANSDNSDTVNTGSKQVANG